MISISYGFVVSFLPLLNIKIICYLGNHGLVDDATLAMEPWAPTFIPLLSLLKALPKAVL